MVLPGERAGNDLGRGGGSPIHEHHQRHIQRGAIVSNSGDRLILSTPFLLEIKLMNQHLRPLMF